MPPKSNGYGLTQARLKELLDYDEASGEFRWRELRGCSSVGKVAGGLDNGGYVRIIVDTREYKAHRLAFLWKTGEFPSDDVDHKNGIRTDNRWENLRKATRSENRQNIGGPMGGNTSGFLGISRGAYGWVAQIQTNGKRRHVGIFPTPEEAHAAYLKAKAVLHPFSERLREAA